MTDGLRGVLVYRHDTVLSGSAPRHGRNGATQHSTRVAGVLTAVGRDAVLVGLRGDLGTTIRAADREKP